MINIYKIKAKLNLLTTNKERFKGRKIERNKNQCDLKEKEQFN